MYFGQRFIGVFKVLLWDKQRFMTNPNLAINFDTRLYNQHQIEEFFILGAAMTGLTVLTVILLTLTISIAARFLCVCCSETAFVDVESSTFKPKTRIMMVCHS